MFAGNAAGVTFSVALSMVAADQGYSGIPSPRHVALRTGRASRHREPIDLLQRGAEPAARYWVKPERSFSGLLPVSCRALHPPSERSS